MTDPRTAKDTPGPPASGNGALTSWARGRGVLMLGALGVVYGDIGTSPLYALQKVFSIDHGAVLTLLFMAQRWGTHRVGGLFGPVTPIALPQDLPAALRRAAALPVPELRFDPDHASYFLSRITPQLTWAPGMRQWCKRLFLPGPQRR
ncbi:KUP/HAK/KT family potassium transporter [Actinomadura sp. NPDC000600]|uniref:KUP/HAK/KT family potassium transporter n=1 Tax=Actinomadura sp. NPDC000600 TaxID=3154262 RepID=UPI0033941FD2